MIARTTLLLPLLLAAAPCRAVTSFDGGDLALSPSGVAASAPASQGGAGPARNPAFLPLPRKDYTVMLFMNGKNNLGAMMARKLAELETLGSSANVNFVMEIGLEKLKPVCNASSTTCNYPYRADWEGVRRYYVLKDSSGSYSSRIDSSYRLPDPSNQDMGDYRSLVAFANWAKANFPARKYILVIGNHGGAWVDKQKKPKEGSAKGVSYDDLTGNYITTPEIGAALREIGGADVLIFDDCLMQAAEVSAEVGTSAKYILGSEEISYTNHFKPALLFAPLKADPAMTPATFVYGYYRSVAAYLPALWNSTGKYPGTFSVLDTSQTAAFHALVRRYAAASRELMREKPAARAAFRSAMNGVLRYHYKYCADLYDFVGLAQAALAASEPPLGDAAAEVYSLSNELKRHITQSLTPYNVTAGSAEGKDYARSRGISAYIPYQKAGQPAEAQPIYYLAPATLQTKYTDLAFDKETGWSLFIKDLTARQQ